MQKIEVNFEALTLPGHGGNPFILALKSKINKLGIKNANKIKW